MNKRIIKIIEAFDTSTGVIDLKELSEELGVSQRTIRYDIDSLNEELEERQLQTIAKHSKGKLKGDVETLYRFLNTHPALDEELAKDYKDILILIIIAFEETINISKLCKQFDLGRTTIKTVLKDTKSILDLYKLRLVSNSQAGLALEGSEDNIRRLQLKLLNQYNSPNNISQFERQYILKKLNVYLEGIDKTSINKFITSIMDSLKRVISDEAYNTITNYILIMVNRIKNNRVLQEYSNKNFFYETEEYKIIKISTPILEGSYTIHINNYELLKLTDYFLGSHLYNSDSSFLSNWIEIEILTKRIIQRFSEISRLDLNRDKVLLEGLINHIKPTIYRIKNFTQLENSIEEEFIENYPNIFRASEEALKLLEDFIGQKIPYDETAFMGIHFKAAMDRNRVFNKANKNILIVCGMGYGTSKLIAQQIRDIYEVNIMDIIPENQLTNFVETSEIDVILSTSLTEDIFSDIPVIRVSPIMTSTDFTRLDSYNLPKYSNRIPLSLLINAVEENSTITNMKGLVGKLKEVCGKSLIDDLNKNSLKLYDLLNSQSVSLVTRCNTWEEAVQLGGDLLKANGNTNDRYTEKMIESIRKNGSYMVTEDCLALPHAKSEGDVFETGMSLMVLKEPVVFPQGLRVNTILSFCSLDGKEHLTSLTEFTELVKKYDFLEFLKKVGTKKKIIDKLNKFEFLSKIGKR